MTNSTPPSTPNPLSTHSEVTESPATDSPTSEAPATDAPITESPATESPATESPDTASPATPPSRRIVSADFIEATPGAAGQWVLASPFLVFAGWLFVDLFAALANIPWRWVEVVVAVTVYLCLVVLPLGVLAHRIVTSLPRIFQHAGWDVAPLEPVSEAEQYSVRYRHKELKRAPFTWSRTWLRAAQGWVYIEIFAILGGAIALIPIFISASEFGFGR